MTRCIFSGSFDPFTVGHLDIATRGAAIFDTLDVVILHNPAKQGLFPLEERMDMIRRATARLSNVEVHAWDGLMADYARESGANAILRGVRNAGDMDSETTMARLNRMLYPGAETLLLPCDPRYAAYSSSAAKEIASFGGAYEPLIPEVNLETVRIRFDTIRRKTNGIQG